MMATPTQKEINSVLEGYNLASGAADYAESIVLEMREIENDNYQMVWSTENNGTFEPNR